ncbi:16672_t:CDS:10 [Dentiscutata erythropus]|uniref:16672_t:CDS:1 n=1 Tax=Dentiscutata erythropus TaxID=1348616 RepID=A0A9N8ZDC9_9GLOM|nr:16672_t:CDS:10 [Dentiscutata erythropus]
MTWLQSNEFTSYIDANFLAASQTPDYSKVRRQSQVMGWFWWTREQKFEKYSIENLKRLSALLLNASKHGGDDDEMTESMKEITQILIWDESMVRAAVRTVTLNIFAVNDEQMQDFILDRNAAPYFSNLTYFIANHASILNDIITSPTEKMNSVLTTRLIDLLLQPIYADSLVDKKLLPSQQRIRINSVIALALLCHVLHIFRYPPLVTDMIAMLFSNSPAMMDYSCSPPTRFERPKPSLRRNLYRESIMNFLIPDISAEHPDLNTLPALCLLYMSCRNHAIAPDVLIATDVDSDEYMPDDASISDRRQSFDTESIMSNSTSASQVKPLFIDGNDESHFNVPSYKSVRGLFIDDDDGGPQYGSVSIPTIKISSDDVYNNGPQHARNYREELIRLVLALLCQHYHRCRAITLQMAVEVLLELLYYNGSGECLTPDQIESMTKAENEIQELLKTYSSDNFDEFFSDENEKAVADSMFAGDKYVGEIIMSAKLLYPPPVEANKEKQKIVDDNDAAKYIKILHLLRQARKLLSRQ